MYFGSLPMSESRDVGKEEGPGWNAARIYAQRGRMKIDPERRSWEDHQPPVHADRISKLHHSEDLCCTSLQAVDSALFQGCYVDLPGICFFFSCIPCDAGHLHDEAPQDLSCQLAAP